MTKRTNRVAWGLAIALTVVVLAGAGPFYLWCKAYWTARNKGEGAKLRRAWLILAPLRGTKLNGADLREANLTGANLAGADLSEARLEKAWLRGANLAKAVLVGADLTAADLHHADLRGSEVWSIMNRANLRGADLRGTLLVVNLDGADLTHAKLQNVSLVDGHLRGAILRNANLSNARLGNESPDLGTLDLRGADLRGAVLTNLVYYPSTRWPKGFDPKKHGARPLEPKADLRGLNLDSIYLESMRLQEANLEGASLRQADLEGARLQKANLKGADLTGAKLTDVRLSGAVYDQRTRWPQGFDVQQHLAGESAPVRRPKGWQRLLRQRRRLPDDRILSLEAVTYGKEHPWPPGWANGWIVSPHPTLYLWVVLRGSDARPSPSPHSIQAVVSDGQGWSAVSGTGPEVHNTVDRRNHRQAAIVATWEFPTFPRRGRSFQARFYTVGGPTLLAKFDVPNPLPGPHPVWKPQRLPATKQDGDVAFSLTRLITGVPLKNRPASLPEESAWSLATFRVRQNGKSTQAWLPRLVEGNDETGNAETFYYSWV